MILLIMAAGSVLVGVPVENVSETMRPLPVHRLGDAPPFVLGATAVRGKPTPVLALATLLGLDSKSSADARTRWVTVRVKDQQVAISVDAVLGIQDIPVEEMRALPALLTGADTAMVTGLGQRDHGLLVVLDGARLIPEELLARLTQPEATVA